MEERMNEGHTLHLEVRDYECDLQGIVNNSIYQNYLEHARHKMIKEKGMNFAELAKKGIDLIVVRVEIDYKYPLVSGDLFYIYSEMNKESRLKIGFKQVIKRKKDDKLIVNAKVIGAAIGKDRRPILIENISKNFKL